MIKIITSIMLFFSLGTYDVFAQPYTKDSLQFKIYTIVSFKDYHVKNIKLDRVFCDYCSKSQLAALRQLGLRSSKKLAKEDRDRLINGEKRYTIFLRIAKKVFADIKRKDTIN